MVTVSEKNEIDSTPVGDGSRKLAARGVNPTCSLIPDELGFYEVDLHNFEVEGIQGIYKESSEQLEVVNRLLATPTLYAEYGTPKLSRIHGLDDKLIRCKTLDDTLVCAQIKDLKYIQIPSRPGMSLVGKIKPHGPLAEKLSDVINNDNELILGIRSLARITPDVDTGDKLVAVKEIITFDVITPPF